MLDSQHVEELEHTDLSFFDFPEQRECEYPNQRDDTDGYEGYEVDKEFRFIRSLDSVVLDEVLLQEAQGVQRGHSIVEEVEQAPIQGTNLSL